MDQIFITKIHINKARHLHDIDIFIDENQKKHLIITGRNGSGKTSLLFFMKKYFEGLITNLQNVPPIHKTELNEKYEREACVTNSYSLNNIKVVSAFLSGKFIFSVFEARRYSKPIVPKGIEKVDLSPFGIVEERINQKFVQHMVNLKAQRSFARDANNFDKVKKIDKWVGTFQEALKNIFEDENLILEFDSDNYNFKLHSTGREPFDFNTLADGYSAILSIVTELVLRMEDNKQNGYDVNGIVLIDEIETHLHVELQKKILPFLTSFFPNIQFIVTTHSPFVISSLSNAVVYDLENKIQVEDLSGYPYDGLIESYFNVDKYSEKIKTKINTYDALVQKDNPDESELEQMLDLRNYLKQIPADLAPELASRFNEIELARKSRGKNGERG